ncbi:hypothetical protein RO3G_13966 [Rhizopus delemar RA 99-880]|uniref:Uncharacterized protein n=1 Tax=Rhizopus delemar (strain RA 99-880 / ATCC MYA-4621 / FGSC 9543 / NRRL 43880) TaxID=246409 RepID=I1CLC5_RHIO9|nr:hypothetical protein RO3G_13966 [Rhizopus delemar RA 99-880]|eukprot:EIE89255.1 hypothetical protein RO3G_13966 [Rhizopus delemar RA 99-880]
MKHSPHTILSELTDFLSGIKRLNVPVYTVWDSIEDVEIVKKFSSKQYHIPNLFLLDEKSSHLLDIGGVYLRLFGLGGAVDPLKADFTISGSFHSQYVAAYNLYARQSEIDYELIQSQNSFMQLWEYINQV